jgi:hypothetical protein
MTINSGIKLAINTAVWASGLLLLVGLIVGGYFYYELFLRKFDNKPARESYSYQVEVTDFNGAVGVMQDYYLRPEELVIVARDDYGNEPVEIYHKTLSSLQSKRVEKFLKNFPLESLKDAYVDENMLDGKQIFFKFRIPGKEARDIDLANEHQEDLSTICSEINSLAPLKLMLNC